MVVVDVPRDEVDVLRAGVVLVETDVRVGVEVRDEVTVLVVVPFSARVVVVVVVLPVELIRVETVVIPGATVPRDEAAPVVVVVAVPRDEVAVEVVVVLDGVAAVELPVLSLRREPVLVLALTVVEVLVEAAVLPREPVLTLLLLLEAVLPLYVVVAAPLGFWRA